MSFRRKYYDIFSLVYDFIIQLHSKDEAASLRSYIVDKANVPNESKVLDICTGTGSVAIAFSRKFGVKLMVVAVDFSRGMLRRAKKKITIMGLKNIYMVEANVCALPFKDSMFESVTCSHAFYELKGQEREKTLKEVVRTLKEDGKFLMMEHEIPTNLILRMLFYVRMYTMGSRDAKVFLENDTLPFKGYFRKVEKLITPSGRSKLICSKR